MEAFISPPPRIPLYLRFPIWIFKKVTGKDLLPAKILAWYPKAAIGSGVMETLVAHKDGKIDERMLKLVRVQASFAANCAFCIDMNSFQYQKTGITPDELLVLQGGKIFQEVPTFSEREKLAVQYARLVSSTPLKFPPEFFAELRSNFTDREIVILASTAAQVNYWARLIQALGVPPAGFSDRCEFQSPIQ
jgi:alkylhydroperoxidase family enzyme